MVNLVRFNPIDFPSKANDIKSNDKTGKSLVSELHLWLVRKRLCMRFWDCQKWNHASYRQPHRIHSNDEHWEHWILLYSDAYALHSPTYIWIVSISNLDCLFCFHLLIARRSSSFFYLAVRFHFSVRPLFVDAWILSVFWFVFGSDRLLFACYVNYVGIVADYILKLPLTMMIFIWK